MLQEGTILAVFDEDTAELAAEYHMEDAYDNCSTAMSGGGGGGGGVSNKLCITCRLFDTPLF